MKNNLKFPIYLFIIIFVAKFGYIIAESFYNYYVLVTTTSPDLNKEVMESLNKNGHMISSIGITLLLVPIYYFVVKKYNEKIIYATITVATIVTYSVTYNLLNHVVDIIVKSNKEKRYDAYYINIFKYGILNNIFAYNSFIDVDKIATNTLNVNDRILLTNSFLLLYADKEIVAKLKERGKNAVADIYIAQYDKETYDRSFKEFENAATQVQELWKNYNDARASFDKSLQLLESETIIKEQHKNLIESIKLKYDIYKNSIDNLNNKIIKATSAENLKVLKKELDIYFQHESYAEAQQKYRAKMEKTFGHFVTPISWLNSSGYLTDASMEACIRKEIKKAAEESANSIPAGMSAKDFMNHPEVKNEVAKQLKNNGILIPKDFDYSYAQFKKYYNIMSVQKYNSAPQQFYKELRTKIGKNDLNLTDDWNSFIKSEFIRSKISSNLPDTSKKDIDNIIKAIESKDLGNFKKLIYLPKVVDKIDEMMYTEKDFLDGAKAAKIGDEAIKLLYIPPFALAISILALLLNMVTVIGMSLYYIKVPNIGVNLVKIVLTAVVVLTPMLNNYDGLDNKLIKKVSTDEFQTYLDFLNWISYYESINYSLHK